MTLARIKTCLFSNCLMVSKIINQVVPLRLGKCIEGGLC
jgi:hypothetical protein